VEVAYLPVFCKLAYYTGEAYPDSAKILEKFSERTFGDCHRFA
jgi:hypothetical protein